MPASMAFVNDSNRPQPLWQPPPTACLTASGAASEVPSLLMHPSVHPAAFSPLPSSDRPLLLSNQSSTLMVGGVPRPPKVCAPTPRPLGWDRHFDKKAQEIPGAKENFFQGIFELLQF